MHGTMIYGPPALRVRWVPDDEPYDWGDVEPTPEEERELEVYGCAMDVRRPACPCCGRAACWEPGPSLWGIANPDRDYALEVERDLMAEVV